MIKVHQLGDGTFAVPLANGALLLGRGDVVAPNPALILTGSQVDALAEILDGAAVQLREKVNAIARERGEGNE